MGNKKNDIEACLTEVKTAISVGKWLVVPRMKNQQAAEKYGLTSRNVRAMLMALTLKDYSEGPVDDHDVDGQDCWVFGSLIEHGPKCEKVEMYLKFVLERLPGGTNRLKLLSVHDAEEPLQYPYGGDSSYLETTDDH